MIVPPDGYLGPLGYCVFCNCGPPGLRHPFCEPACSAKFLLFSLLLVNFLGGLTFQVFKSPALLRFLAK